VKDHQDYGFLLENLSPISNECQNGQDSQGIEKPNPHPYQQKIIQETTSKVPLISFNA